MRLCIFYKCFLFTTLFIILSVFSFGQVTKIMGKITDAGTKEPVPFANIILKGTSIGATSDFNGYFSIVTRNAPIDTLVISYIGYKTREIKIRRGVFQELNIEMDLSEFILKEVEIVPGENPAEIILKKIIDNKENNNKKNYNAYQYEVYSKIQIDLNNISDKVRERKILKPFRFVFNYIDTSAINGKAYLPVFLSETVSDVYFQQEPSISKEFIKATRISGLENESISQFLGELYQNVNIYDNYIQIFEKNFVSPIANFGLGFYRYYLIDSAFIDNDWCYQIMFKSRRKQELTFMGEFWVNDTSWAIKNVNIKIAKDANINFINNITVKQEYDEIDGKYWMLTKDYFLADFNIIQNSRKTFGFYGHKTTTYRNFIFNKPKPGKFYQTPVSVYVEEGSYDKDSEYWEVARHEKLTERERSIYEMVDSVKSVPVFRTWVDFFYLITNGYLVWGPVEVGPLYKAISFNPVEGVRLRVGGRTSNQFSKNLMIDGHVAYGTKDERLKYGLGFLYMLSKNPKKAVSASYLYDMEQLGESQNAFSEDNLFSSLLRRSPADKLSMVRQYKLGYNHEWFTGFSTTLNLIHRDIKPFKDENFIIYNDGKTLEKNSIVTSEIGLDLRFAYNEKFVMGEFERISLGTTYPVLDIKYGYGVPNVLNGEYSYHRLQVGLRHWFNVFSFGWSKYIIEAGKIFGKLPYPLLKLHPGNETFIFDEYAYNLMNYYEFVSDQYISVYYTHHFDGLLLNKIPLMRKLKFREVAFIKGVWGTLSNENKDYSELPHESYTLKRPYVETGVGIENILQIFRIDAVWRLTHLDHPDVTRFALFFSFHFYF